MTAVEWLMQTLEQNNIIDLDIIDSDKYYTIIDQAKEMEKQQTEISDEEIKKAGNYFYPLLGEQSKKSLWINGCKWYREQLKQL